MFDWDDEDLTHMLWEDDDGETGDHIVPFKVRCEQRNKKEQSNESNKAVKLSKQTKTSLRDDGKLGSSSGHNIDKRIPNQDFCMTSWPDSSLSHAREAVPGSSATDESKEQGDYDEWANIGSFDDLDRMFSNDVPIFGANTPSKQLLSVLDSQDLGLDIREQQVNQQFPLSVPSVGVTSKHEQYHEHKGQPSAENQTYQQTKMINFSEMSGASKAGAFHDPYGRRKLYRNSPGNFVNQLAPSQTSLTAINLQKSEESQGSGTPQYPQMPNQYMATSGFGNHTNPYSSEVLQRPDVKNQLMHPSYYNPATAISLNMVTDGSTRTMTPQEKLEKLRRRQQIQAMVAIQRQQQQFRHQVQVPVADQSIIQNYCQDNPLQLVDKAKLQGLTAMPSFDLSSSLEPGDSGNFAAAAAVDNSSEFSVLYLLQDVVAKLDTGTRTCIRDSLFRLADSASQRYHTSDKTSQEVTPKEKSRFRYGGMLDTETVTNPTDRTVAHLLFHRPFDMSAAKHMEGGLESPASSKMGIEVEGEAS